MKRIVVIDTNDLDVYVELGIANEWLANLIGYTPPPGFFITSITVTEMKRMRSLRMIRIEKISVRKKHA